MKKLIYLICFLPLLAMSQGRTNDTIPCTGCSVSLTPFLKGPTTDTIARRFFLGFGSGKSMEVMSKSQVRAAITASGGTTITAGPITSLPVLAYNPGTNLTPGQWIQAVYYQSQAPTATLTGGSTQELHSAGTFSGTLNWSAGRQAATQTLSSIVVATIAQTFSQPSAPGTVSGTQSVTVTWNTNTTYTNTVTTTDSKMASATTTYAFLPRIYVGRSTSATPTSTEIVTAAGASSTPLQAGHAGSWTVTASGSNHPFFASASNQGTVTVIKDVNNFDVTSLFTPSTVSVTNASGFTQNYNVFSLTSATSSNYFFTTN